MKTAKANKITNHYNARIVVGILINKAKIFMNIYIIQHLKP